MTNSSEVQLGRSRPYDGGRADAPVRGRRILLGSRPVRPCLGSPARPPLVAAPVSFGERVEHLELRPVRPGLGPPSRPSHVDRR